MNRLFNRLMYLSPKLLTNEIKVNRNCYSFVSNKYKYNYNSNILSMKTIGVNSGLNYNSEHKYSNIKTERKESPKAVKTSIDSEFQSLKAKKRLLRKKAILQTSEQLFSVLAFSTAEEYNIEELAEGLKTQGLYELTPFGDEVEDVLHLSARYEVNGRRRELFVFREGSIVCWNMPYVECEAILKFLKPFESNSYDQRIIDEEQEEMHYELIGSKTKLQKGLICLNNNEENESDFEKYAFSNAIALSVKLAIWESSLDRYIHSIEFVSQDMKEGGKIKLTRDQVFRKTGELFDLKHDINLSSDLLDTPDFYWDRQELEKLFLDTIYHLNIRKRTNVMNEKLNHCIELMELLSSHLNDEHHVRLEWMIIVLIMVEVVFECIHYLDRFL